MNLYKYSKVNDHTKVNLIENKMYFSSIKVFNDPYEFIFKFNVSDDVYIDFLKTIFGCEYGTILDMKMNKSEVLGKVRDKLYPDLINSLGVACLSENENDDLMWAHYGDCHKGICIEYDMSMYPFNKCEKVEYVNAVKEISVKNCSYFENNVGKAFNDVLLRKNRIWSYENEWRLVGEIDKFIYYEPAAIKSITFGFNCKKDVINDMLKITNHLSIKYYNVGRLKNEYKIGKIPLYP